jgi:hypothetical protein
VPLKTALPIMDSFTSLKQLEKYVLGDALTLPFMELYDLYRMAYPLFQKLGLTKLDAAIIQPKDLVGPNMTGPFTWVEFNQAKRIFEITGDPIDIIHKAGMISDDEKMFLETTQLNAKRLHNLILDNNKVYIEYGRRMIAPRQWEDSPTLTIRFYKWEFFRHFRNRNQKVAMVELILKSLVSLHSRYSMLHVPELVDFGNEDF